ncbi:alpha/beta fold hydrolase [Bacteroides heparinolyticus]|uniref:alpha/beta fold hydrolase n=1 Tax=Prevotella heparinolytica TaxID=28113 RepID=UPI0035A0A0BB
MKHKLIFLLLICLVVFPGMVSPTNKPAKTHTLKIALFDVDATPPVGSRLAYDPMINSGEQALRAKGIVLFGEGDPIVLCAVDWIGIANESQDAFKEALAEAAGTIPNRVVVHTVHQHDAPICDFTAEKILKENNIPAGCFDGTFARELIQRLQSSIRLSLKDVKEVTEIGVGRAEIHQVASNRRVYKKEGKIITMRGSSCKDSLLRAMPEGLIDPEVSLVSFWNKNTPLAVLSFYATHPQSYYLTQTTHPDFPGIARFLRQLAVPDALHVHFNGAGGNVAAGKYNDGSHETRFILAKRMADGMERAWNNTQKFSVQPEDLDWDTENLFLPYRDKVKEIETAMKQMDDRSLANNMGRLGWYKRRVAGKGIEIACLRIHDARLLFMPGELFVEYQLAAKKMAPDHFVAMAAYGDYGPFYIGTEAAYAEGGYEIESSPVTAESEKLILAKLKRLLERNMTNRPRELLTYKDRNGQIFSVTNKKEWEKKREEILNNMQLVMGKLPSRQKKKMHAVYTDSVVYGKYIRYSINFEAAPSEKVYAYLYRPKNKLKASPAVLALHGTGIEGKKIIDGATGIENRAYAKELAERGYVVISPDYPSMGELEDYDFANDRYDSGTMKGIFNHISCVDLLQSLPYVDNKRIGVIGHSLGGHNALFVAAFDPRIKVIVSSCGWTLMDYYHPGEQVTAGYGGRLGPWAQERYMPFIRDKYNLDAEKIPFDFDEIIASLAPRPFYSNSPVYDLNFSIEGVRKGISHVREAYRFWGSEDHLKIVYPQSSHDFPSDIREDAYRFIDKYLK